MILLKQNGSWIGNLTDYLRGVENGGKFPDFIQYPHSQDAAQRVLVAYQIARQLGSIAAYLPCGHIGASSRLNPYIDDGTTSGAYCATCYYGALAIRENKQPPVYISHPQGSVPLKPLDTVPQISILSKDVGAIIHIPPGLVEWFGPYVGYLHGVVVDGGSWSIVNHVANNCKNGEGWPKWVTNRKLTNNGMWTPKAGSHLIAVDRRKISNWDLTSVRVIEKWEPARAEVMETIVRGIWRAFYRDTREGDVEPLEGVWEEMFSNKGFVMVQEKHKQLLANWKRTK